MKILDSILNLIMPRRFRPAERDFRAKDDFFRLKLSDNWIYSRDKNKYYYFGNEGLEGGFEILLF